MVTTTPCVSVGKYMVHVYVLHRMAWYGSKVDHLLMPGCPEVENSYQDPFPSLSVFQYSVLIINGCDLEMGVVLLQKKNPPFPSPRSAYQALLHPPIESLGTRLVISIATPTHLIAA